jgi:hypothetical protein
MSDDGMSRVLEELTALRREVAEVREKLAYREQVFVGWKAIADYLKLSEDHCKELGKDPVDHIPHWHQGGMVAAYRTALDAWTFRRRKPAQRRVARSEGVMPGKTQIDMFERPGQPKRGRATDGSAS